MRPSFLYVVAICTALVTSRAGAADPPAQDCSKVLDYAEMVACVGRDAREANTQVTQAYELLMKRLGASPAADKLRHSQKAWLEYQSAYCDFVKSANEGGSIVRVTGASCYASTAKSRLKELEYQVNCQEGWSGCFREH